MSFEFITQAKYEFNCWKTTQSLQHRAAEKKFSSEICTTMVASRIKSVIKNNKGGHIKLRNAEHTDNKHVGLLNTPDTHLPFMIHCYIMSKLNVSVSVCDHH